MLLPSESVKQCGLFARATLSPGTPVAPGRALTNDGLVPPECNVDRHPAFPTRIRQRARKNAASLSAAACRLSLIHISEPTRRS
eukprot:6795293-Prymnesium_polylepis.1